MIVAYYLIGLPTACVLAFSAKQGAAGMVSGMLIGKCSHALAFGWLTARTDWEVAAANAARRVKEEAAAADITHVIAEPAGSREETFSKSLGGKIHLLSSRHATTPAGAWRTICGWHFAKRSCAWRLATDAEAEASGRPWCDKCMAGRQRQRCCEHLHDAAQCVTVVRCR